MSQEEFERQQSEYLKGIPVAFHSFVRQQAWEAGHAYGYEEVLLHISELTFALIPAIEAYKANP